MTETRLLPRVGEPPEAAARRLRALLDINVSLAAVADLDRLLSSVLHATTRALDCEAAAVLLHEPRENVLRFAAATGDPGGKLAEVRVPLAGSLAGTIYTEGRALLAVDLEHDARHYDRPAEATGLEPRVLLGVPLRVGDESIGVLEALNPREAFDAVDAEMLLVLAAQAAVAIRDARRREALAAAHVRLADLDRLKSDFMAVASHELRTPLAALRGFGEVLRDEVQPDLAEHAGEVVEAARRMETIVETLEEVGSAQEPGPAGGEPVEITGVLSEAASTLDRTVLLRVPPVPLRVRGEPHGLRAAFGHLLHNADRFSPPEADIRVEASASGADALVRIQDRGRGLAADDTERIFEAFEQADAPLTRRTEGLGVGLTIVQSVVLRHGGRVWATSAGEGQGSTFHVRLPLAPEVALAA